jgi:membrane protein implicated in regulation of membrane protease activity
MAIAIVVVAWATGGDLVRAALIAGAFFVAATAWGWRRWRERLREETARDANGPATPT